MYGQEYENLSPDNILHNDKNNRVREIITLIQKTPNIAVVYVYKTSIFHTPVTCRIHDDHSITPTCGVERIKLAIRTETCKIAKIWLIIESYKFNRKCQDYVYIFNNILWSQALTHKSWHASAPDCFRRIWFAILSKRTSYSLVKWMMFSQHTNIITLSR